MRILLLLFPAFLFSSDFSSLLTTNKSFLSDITITDSDSLISKGSLSYNNGDFIYTINYPSSQIIADSNNTLFVQDDDFKQVMTYTNNSSFLIKELLTGSYLVDELSCLAECFKVSVNDGRIESAIIIFQNNKIYEMHITDFQTNNFLVKFENFSHESTNISYMPPQGYEVIINDWFRAS